MLAGVLYGLPVSDQASLASAVAVPVAAAFAGCDVPARRAGRLDPMVTLRGD